METHKQQLPLVSAFLIQSRLWFVLSHLHTQRSHPGSLYILLEHRGGQAVSRLISLYPWPIIIVSLSSQADIINRDCH